MPISLKNTASVLPWARYSPQANLLTVAGEDNKPREIPFVGRSFAVDIENGSMGHLLIGEGVRDWKPFPIGDVTPPAPATTYKRGFAVLLYAPKLLGSPEAHEMCSSTGAHLSFCERLYNEAEPKFGEGNVPIVRITEAEPIKIGKGKSRELHFKIEKWIPRSDAFVEALAKLKAATNGSPNKAAAGGAADNAGDDFDDEDVTSASSKEETTDKPEEATTAKPKKGRGKAQPDTSDILDDQVPFG